MGVDESGPEDIVNYKGLSIRELLEVNVLTLEELILRKAISTIPQRCNNL